MGERRIYRGQLVTTGNGEDDDLLGLMVSASELPKILAEELTDDMIQHGRYLSVRYFVTDTPVPADELPEALMRHLYGEARFDYGMHYSEITGYLWTDEELQVGGHDLLAELETMKGKHLHLEVEFASTPAEPSSARTQPPSDLETHPAITPAVSPRTEKTP